MWAGLLGWFALGAQPVAAGEEETVLLAMGAALVPDGGQAQVPQNGLISEGAYRLKNILQNPGTQCVLTGAGGGAYDQVELVHGTRVVYNNWLEMAAPAVFPAKGLEGRLVFQTRYKVECTDPAAGVGTVVGFSCRSAVQYADVIINADELKTPLATAAAVGQGSWNDLRFEVVILTGEAHAYLNGEKVKSLVLGDQARQLLQTVDVAHTRFYFRTEHPSYKEDKVNPPVLPATQTYTVDSVQVSFFHPPTVSPTDRPRKFFWVDRQFTHLEDPTAVEIPAGDTLAEGAHRLAHQATGAGTVVRLAGLPAGQAYPRVEIEHSTVVTGADGLDLLYPAVYPGYGSPQPIVFEAVVGVAAADSAAGLQYSLGLSSATEEDGTPLFDGTLFRTPAITTSAADATPRTFRFEVHPADGRGRIYDGSTLVHEAWLPAAALTALQRQDLAGARFHFHTLRGDLGHGTPLPTTQTFTVSAVRVFKNYLPITPGNVAQAYAGQAPAVFPRLLADAVDFSRIQEALADGDPMFAKMRSKLLETADKLVHQDGSGNYTIPPQPWQLDSGNLRVFPIHNFASQIGELTVAYRLTGDVRYADRAWAQIDLMNQYQDWGANRHFLDTGVACFNYGLARDLLDDYLTAAQKDAMWAALWSKGLQPGLTQMRGNTWWHTSIFNWNSVCHSGLILGALSFFDRDPTNLSEVVSLAAEGYVPYLDAFYPDGQSAEGADYWGYGINYLTMGLEGLTRVLGTDFGLSDSVGLRRTRFFPLLIAGPAATLNFGDDGLKNGVGNSENWLARRYDDKALTRAIHTHWDTYGSYDWRDLLWFDPAQLGSASASFADRDYYIEGVALLALREAWGDPSAFFAGLHGGDNNASHGHLDAGSFYLQAGGVPFVWGNLGADDYNSPGFFNNDSLPGYLATTDLTTQVNAGRWHFYNTRTEGKSAVVIKPRATPGDVRPEQDPRGVARVARLVSKNDSAFGVLDLQPVYHRDVTAYQRGVRLWHGRQAATLQDELTVREDSTVCWILHHPGQATLTQEGRGALLLYGGKSLVVRLVSPAGAVFTRDPRPVSYLEGESFPLTDNRKIPGDASKLMIRLEVDAGQSVTLAVEFAESGTNLPWALPQPMADWEHEAGWALLDLAGEGAVHSGWYGWFWFFTPWIYHAEHGWQYLSADGPGTVYAWDFGLGGWIWTSQGHYPWLYDFAGDGRWLYYLPGGSPGQRQFWDPVANQTITD